ncbi:MAG TPA: hypothetical protein VGL10_06660 [Gammaproteobacteria bacterium]
MDYPRINRRQAGAALLLMMLALIVFIGALFVVSSDDAEKNRIGRREQTVRVLAKAKEALLAHALIDAISTPQLTPRPGELPCPDSNGDGKSDAGGCADSIGWLPWVTLELEDLRDASGNRLWYAVSEDFQDDGGSEPKINSGNITTGQFRILDAMGTELDRAAALIIAPEEPLSGQTRFAAETDLGAVIQNYLENENNNLNDSYTNEITPGLNDQLMVITVDNIIQRVAALAVREAAVALQNYYDDKDFYPYAESDAAASCDAGTAGAAYNIGFLPIQIDAGCAYGEDLTDYGLPDWIVTQEWYKHVLAIVAEPCTYSSNPADLNCNKAGTLLSLDGNGGIRAMVVHIGPQLSNITCDTKSNYNQNRAGGIYDDVCNYLETAENTDGDDDPDYIQSAASATVNDVFLIVSP